MRLLDRRRAVAACATWLLLSAPPGLPVAAAHGGHDDAASVIDGRRRDPKQMDARAELLARAEAQLARGEADAATDTFEQAAGMLHAADTEMGLVRAQMQAGHYPQALAFCAHTAGVHRDSPEAAGLYAWLLRLGGQDAFARRTLEQALERTPDDAVLNETRRAFAAGLPVASAPLLPTPHRMAPQATMLDDAPAPVAAARVVGGAVLIGQGRLALVPRAALNGTEHDALWLRNGLGQTTRAQVQPDAVIEGQGVVVLRLSTPMDAGRPTPHSPREPFAGSPGFVLQYAHQADGAPAWPWLSQGFFGRLPAQGGSRALGIELPGASFGGPVFDAQGRLAGMVLPGPGGEALMLAAAKWQGLEGIAPAASAATGVAHAQADQVYETGMRLALQLIAVPAPR